MTINDESCNGNDGSITGITASGGTGTLTYSWSPSGATTADLTAVPNGSYTLTVTDGSGCTATSGPHTINQIAGPTYDDSGINITRSEEHTSELQSRPHLVCRLLLEKKKNT